MDVVTYVSISPGHEKAQNPGFQAEAGKSNFSLGFVLEIIQNLARLRDANFLNRERS